VWILILKRWNNNRIYSFLTMMCGDRALHGIFECEMCKNTNCDLIFDKCYHTFHSNCIDSVEEYVTAKVCPKCLDQKLINRVYPNIISKMIKGLNINRLSLISLVVFGAAINGVYNYGQNYWNFPNWLDAKWPENMEWTRIYITKADRHSEHRDRSSNMPYQLLLRVNC